MNKYEEISFILSDYYSYVEQFFGDIIKQRLEIPNYENGVLTSNLTNVKRKFNKSDSEELSCDIDEDGSGLDLDLYRLDQTICYGTRAYHKEYCEGFNLIFSDIDLSQYQDADSKITDILAEVKAFEFLARYHFSNTTRLEKKTSQHAIEFTAHRNNKNYAVKVARLGSAQNVENHCKEYEINFLEDWLSGDITMLVRQQYAPIEQFCQHTTGAWNGILFISSGRDYFGHIRHEKKVYCLKTQSIIGVLRQEWQALKKTEDNHKYLSHIVVTTGKNIRNAIVYPIM